MKFSVRQSLRSTYLPYYYNRFSLLWRILTHFFHPKSAVLFIERGLVQFLFPAGDDDRSHAVATDVADRADHVEEAVDAQEDGDASVGRLKAAAVAATTMMPAPGTPAIPLVDSMSVTMTSSCCSMGIWIP